MPALSRSSLLEALEAKCPGAGSCGYVYNVIDLPQRRLGPRAGLPRLVRSTARVLRRVGSPRCLLFNDGLAGWRGVPRRGKAAPMELASGEALELLVRRMFFRHPSRRSDNYYLTDRTLEWFVVFCHEDDWHLIAPRRLLRAVSLA